MSVFVFITVAQAFAMVTVRATELVGVRAEGATTNSRLSLWSQCPRFQTDTQAPAQTTSLLP